MKHGLLGIKVGDGSTEPLFHCYDLVKQTRSNVPPVIGEADEKSFTGLSGAEMKVVLNTLNFVKSQRHKMSAEVSVGGLFGIGGGVEFATENKVSELSLTVLITSTKIMGELAVKNAKFKEGFAPNERETLDGYVRVHGDSFVSSVRSGGMFWAAYNFHSKTIEEKKELEAKLNASGIIKIVTFDVEAQTKFNDFLAKVNMDVDIKIGSVGTDDLDYTPAWNDPMGFALKFPSMPLKKPVILNVEFNGYENLDKADNFLPIAKNRDLLVGENGLLLKKAALNRIKEEIELIQDVHMRFGQHKEDALAHKKAKILSGLKEIESVKKEYEENPTSPLINPKMQSLSGEEIFPVMDYSTPPIKYYGGDTGGVAFSSIDENNWRYSFPRIEKLLMRTGHSEEIGPVVNQLIITYSKMKQGTKGLVSTHETTEMKYGHSSGNHSQVLELNPRSKKPIQKIEGRSGVYLNHLKFSVDENYNIEAGGGGGKPFKIIMEDKHYLIGFSGLCGAHINCIGFHGIEWLSSKWQKNDPCLSDD